ncbi:MAG: lysoplasmalogenase [Anaerolineae bacterium]|nr:lysoplasmalogenase [Anaerolineae bacterium]MCB0243520.1 lysoplasmalogenase [Anaerolineae bacterium]MCB0250254.1 lysoplasmalogenase [Anaerolineae bacterium]MCB9131883.1 lysoplasmalogenase [Anaerolineales bacterium]MCO5246074.1 lysoplasmalogenase [Anaerolineae bacterium]
MTVTFASSLLVLLLLTWAALLVGGLLIDFGGRTARNRLPLAARMATSAMLTAAALVWWLGATRGTALAGYGLLIFAGMTLGFLGDLVMAKVIRTPNRVIFGMLAFGGGHLCYIAAFLGLGRALAKQSGAPLAPLVAIWAVYAAASALLWYTLIRQPARGRALNIGTLVYAVLIGAMAGSAMWLATAQPGLLPLALGGLLFIASDMFVGSELMRGTSFRSIGDVIWTTYTVAQFLIVYSTAIVLQIV